MCEAVTVIIDLIQAYDQLLQHNQINHTSAIDLICNKVTNQMSEDIAFEVLIHLQKFLHQHFDNLKQVQTTEIGLEAEKF